MYTVTIRYRKRLISKEGKDLGICTFVHTFKTRSILKARGYIFDLEGDQVQS
jgi:hypothetical protein